MSHKLRVFITVLLLIATAVLIPLSSAAAAELEEIVVTAQLLSKPASIDPMTLLP